MSKENSDSILEEAYRNAETVNACQLDELCKNKPVKTIVCVKEENNKPYLLVATDEEPDKKIWVPYTGETYEQAQKFAKWTFEGEELYKAKARSKEELDELRKILISYGNLCSLIKNKDYCQSTMVLIVNAVTRKWLLNDHPDYKDKYPDVAACEEMYPYSQLVMKYIDRFVTMVDSIKQANKS